MIVKVVIRITIAAAGDPAIAAAEFKVPDFVIGKIRLTADREDVQMPPVQLRKNIGILPVQITRDRPLKVILTPARIDRESAGPGALSFHHHRRGGRPRVQRCVKQEC